MTRSRSLLLALAAAAALIAGALPEITEDPRRYLAFTAMNLAMLAAALWLALPALGGAACLLLFAGPTIWWIDKGTGDILAFAALTITLVSLGRRARNFERRTSNFERLTAAAASAVLLAVAIQPAFGRSLHWPSLAEWLVIPFDPSVGIVSNAPVLSLAVVLAIGVWVAGRPFKIPIDQAAALFAGVALLFTIAQVTNLHAGTPSISRYANWFIPLSVPFMRVAHARAGVRYRRLSWGIAGASAVVCTLVFHPAANPYSREPTVAANFLWTRHPGWNNPLPEVFSEVMHEGESRVVPASTPLCEKLLIAGADGGAIFPVPCFPAEAPPECTSTGALCYANRHGAGYQFVPAPGSVVQHQGFSVEPRFAWPAASTARVRDLFTRWEWWTLRPNAGGGGVLRENPGVRVMELEDARRRVFVLRQPTPGAHLVLRLPWKAAGALIDPATGQTLRLLEFNDEPLSRWELEVPSGFDVLLVFLQAT